MADGKVVIETDLDSSGIEKGLSKIGGLAVKGLSVATGAITGTATALGAVSIAAIKAGADFESQMSRVQAISGATGEEFEKLKNQAIQLGADTAFSSSQAAEGMENLAAAGFTTSEIMDAMPGLLDLAAASGEDLASSSDIAASTLRGFGLEAADAAHVADVLAANANKTNSSVAETGEAMKYIAPLARAAGLSFEETAAAIGIMANAGIQGSQAGTTLRGALSRLSKPTEDMQQAMEELGISFYDSEGKMKSLSEQVSMLQDAMSGMTDEQKNNYLVTLYGQEALSGMLALINEGSGSLAELTAAYETCDGSAKKAAETMQDNLRGAVEQLKGSVESLGIVFYESVADNMKDAAVVATESVNNITDAFNSGGLNEAIRTAGDEFADLSVRAAEHAPGMVDAAVDFIESFANGIIQNRGRLIGAAGEVAESFAGGLAELLPASVQKPVEDAIDAISDSLNSGGLKTAGKTVVKTLDNVIDVVGKLAEVALPPLTKALDFAGENLDALASSATAAFTAFKGYKAVSETNKILSKGIKVWKTASSSVDAYNVVQMACTAQGIVSNATLTVGQAAVGLLTGKVSLATAAHAAWNAVIAANPIGLLITAVGALAAGIGMYVLTTDDAKESQYALTEEQKQANEEIHEQYEAYKELDSARKESLAAINAEYGYIAGLKDELNGLIDSNGQVKSGYEDRANFIVNELSKALGLEKEEIWGISAANGELGASIDSLIEKKRAEASLEAYEESYKQAIQEKAQAIKDVTSSYDEMIKKGGELKTAEEELIKLEKEKNEAQGQGEAVFREAVGRYNSQARAVNELKDAHSDLKDSYMEASETLEGYNATILNYEGVSSAIISGDAAKIEEALLKMQNGFITAEIGTKESLEKQVQNMQSNYEAMRQAVENGTPGVTQQMVDSAKQMVDSAKIELDKLQPQAEESLRKSGEKANQGLASQKPNIDATSKNISDSTNQLLGSADTRSTGAEETSEYNDGLASNSGAIASTSKGLSDVANAEMGAADTGGTGYGQGSDYASGVGSASGESMASGRSLADSADAGASYLDGYRAGSNFGAGFVNGINSWLSSATNAGRNIAYSAYMAAKAALDEHSPSRKTREVGKFFGEGLALGIEGEKRKVRKASESLADTAISSLDMSDISARMREAMAINTGRVTRSFSMLSSTNLSFSNEKNYSLSLSEDDIQRLSKSLELATKRGFTGAKVEMDGHAVGKIVTPTVNEELGKWNRRKT